MDTNEFHRPAPGAPAPTRRRLVQQAAGLPLAVALAGCQGAGTTDRGLSLASLAAAEVELARLSGAPSRRSSATWSWAQTLVHCAQSIEYSMAGFPQSRSRVFQATLGATAFGLFQWRGRMTHDRTEPIPGAPALEAGLEPAAALARLQAAVAAFRQWRSPLRPHFAYGELDAQAYDQAHAMHLADHLSQFDVAA